MDRVEAINTERLGQCRATLSVVRESEYRYKDLDMVRNQCPPGYLHTDELKQVYALSHSLTSLNLVIR